MTPGVSRYTHDPALSDFVAWAEGWLPQAGFEEAVAFYAEAAEMPDSVVAALGLIDRMFLLAVLMRRGDALHPWLYARCREVEADPDGALDLWARGHYKAVALDEPVPTPQGFKKHGDLVPGDLVFGAGGDPVRVVARTPVFADAHCFRVTFDDGYAVTVSGEHRWDVERLTRKRKDGGGRLYRERTVVSTSEMADMDHSGGALLAVPVAPAVRHADRALPVPPYTLGAWLGDGTSANATITCAYVDIQIIEQIRADGHSVSERKSSNANTGLFSIDPGVRGIKGTGMSSILRRMGLLGNKHIPDDYLVASVSQRRALLQGLMDTDGHCNTRGTATFVNKTRRLADGVFDLCASLGLKPRFNTFPTPTGEVYFVSFQAYKKDAPFRLPRKASRCRDGIRKPRRFVRSVEPVPSVPVSCIQVDADDGLYLIGRHHVTTHNSTVITFAGVIQEILRDPDLTVGIFSHTGDIAKAFLKQIKVELATNGTLTRLYHDVLYDRPEKESPKWSENEGITIRRKSNPKEASVEAWGLVDGQPTSKHFGLIVYDDVVTRESVYTPDQITKTTDAWELSTNLGTTRGRRWMIGTRYHQADTWRVIMDREAAKPRIHPATDDGTESGNPVFLTREQLDEKRREMGPYTFAAQMLQNPTADKTQGFKLDWIVRWEPREWRESVRILLVDPASKRKRTSDYTTMGVIGLFPDRTRRVIEWYRDRLNLTERTALLFELHQRYRPAFTGYEEYGLQADIEHVRFMQGVDQRNYAFHITPLGGKMPKIDRILRLVPPFEQRRLWLPTGIQHTDYQGRAYDPTEVFLREEYGDFPVPLHDDMLDMLSRCEDEAVIQAVQYPSSDVPDTKPEWAKKLAAVRPPGGWQGR